MSAPGRALGWAWVGALASIAALALKWGAYALSQSAAILSDAIESFVNLGTSAFALYAVWLSARPRDQDHPYGHGKIEYFSAGVEGGLILFAAGSVAALGIARLIEPVALSAFGPAAAASVAAGVVTALAGTAMVRAARRYESPSLSAGGAHLKADSVTTAATVSGFALAWFTGALWIDGACALVAGAWIGWSGAREVRRAIAGLMDEADDELLDRIGRALESVREPGWVAPHHTRVHRLGSTIHIDLHIVLPAYWTLAAAHEASDAIESAMRAEFGERTDTMVHMESCTPKSCSYCDAVDCPIRTSPLVERYAWSGRHVRAAKRPTPRGAEEGGA